MKPLKVGDKVVRVIDVGRRQQFGSMVGEVTKVGPAKSAGGSKQRVKVLWETGYEASHDDRQVATLEEAGKGIDNANRR